jgi:hypothetical protein
MARRKVNTENGELIEIEEIKQRIRSHIEKNYGGVANFLKTDIGEKMGGQAIRPYLYDKGAVSFEVLRKLCEYFGIGRLSKKTYIVRTVKYRLEK